MRVIVRMRENINDLGSYNHVINRYFSGSGAAEAKAVGRAAEL